MSGQPVSFDTSHPPHGHPENTGPSTQYGDKASTASHPAPTKPDPTTSSPESAPHLIHQHAKRGLSSASSSGSTELSNLKIKLRNSLRQFPDFPSPGILFEDILPIFADPELHDALLRALELHITEAYGDSKKPQVVVGLEARGFLFGPSLALRLGAAFVPVRKQGKLPGPTESASYQKEYGADVFEMQKDAIKPGQRVLIVDDIIATGGTAAAAGSLVTKLGGALLGYVFILELDFLKGRAKLDAPVYTLLTGQEKDQHSDAKAQEDKEGSLS